MVTHKDQPQISSNQRISKKVVRYAAVMKFLWVIWSKVWCIGSHILSKAQSSQVNKNTLSKKGNFLLVPKQLFNLYIGSTHRVAIFFYLKGIEYSHTIWQHFMLPQNSLILNFIPLNWKLSTTALWALVGSVCQNEISNCYFAIHVQGEGGSFFFPLENIYSSLLTPEGMYSSKN